MHSIWLGQGGGTVSFGGGNIVIRKPESRTAEQIAALEEICAVCEWNVNWICEHSGCQPCKQRAAGGLKLYLRMASFICPAGKFKK